MAKGKNNKQSDAAMGESLSRWENVRLIAGFALVIFGIFLVCSIISYLFYWKEDVSAIHETNPRVDVEYMNICGPMGARVAHGLVGSGFGIFAFVIPIFITVLGWRLFRFKSLRLYRFGLICALVLLMGSLTLGAIFKNTWDLFGSGLGGDYGIALSNWLTAHIGFIGTMLIIVIGWITIGILINRNFLRLLGNWCVAGYEKLAAATKDLFAKMRKKKEVEEPVVEDVKEEEEPVEEDVIVDDPVVVVSPDEPVVKQEQGDEDDIFIVEPRDDIKVEEEVTPEEEEVVVDDPQPAPAPVDPDDFYVVPRDDDEGDDEPITREDAADVLGIEEETKDEPGIVVTVTENDVKEVDEQDIDSDLYDPMRDLHNYQAPTPSLLRDHKSQSAFDEEEIFRNKERIRETLLHFHIPIISMHATVGPTVTLYEIVQEPGVKISRIQGLEDDLAQNLKAEKVRIIAPIPGKGTVGIEVPNQIKQTVSMRSAICSEEFQNSKAELPVVIGRTIQNENYTFDLAKMPHLLVAGATGQGKSVGLNAIITSLLYRKHPAELKFVLIDPKMVEFSLYNKLERHFLAKMESEDESIVTDPKKAVYTLNALCTEMANRLELCKKAHAKNIVEYNEKFVARRLNPEHGHRYMPYIVVIIDEFADLIMTAKEVEAPVMRLAQKARAIGIHLIVATQRPDVKVITGGIKANFPARIAFRVMQMTDSRTIIDQPGANQLIGRGDMLFLSGGEPTRIQCAFVDTPEVENIVEHIGAQQGYPAAYNLPDYVPADGAGEASVGFGSEEGGAPQKFDAKFGEIAREAVSSGAISTSMIQRNFEVGFNRAGRIMLQLERAGIVGPQIGSKPREIKYYDLPSLEARLQELGIF